MPSNVGGTTARDSQHKRLRPRGESEESGHLLQTDTAADHGADWSPRVVTPSSTSSPISSKGNAGAASNIMDSRLGTNAHRGKTSPVIPRKIRVEPEGYRTRDDDDDENREPSTSASLFPVMSTDSDEHSGNSNPMANGMKRMIEPYTVGRSPNTSPEKSQFVHHPTAKGSSMGIHSVIEPKLSIRYSLAEGKKAMPESMRRASDGLVASAAERHKSNKLKAAHSLALKADSRLSTSRSGGSSSKRSSETGTSFKIFILLLQPKSKIFELIQLIYDPKDTTIGMIIEKIPENATEAALGAQFYTGLCRPNDQTELLDMDIMASEVRPGMKSAKITLGEILVAIPEGFTGPDVAALSKQILGNPKIVKLLKRSDPLAPKSKRRHRHRSSRSSNARKSVQVLEKHDEKDEFEQEETEKRMKAAMAHAEAEAAAANAAIRSELKRASSFSSQKSSSDVSNEVSLDESYSSWSKSFESSFSAQSSVCSGASRRAIRRHERQERRILILQRTAGVAFCIMVILYALDPRGYKLHSSNKTSGVPVIPEVTETPMGVMGIVQCLFLLLTLYKVERFVRSGTNNHDGSANPRRCPFLRASSQAMVSLQARYAKRLSKKNRNRNGRTGSSDDDSLSHRLRSFSLKAATNTGHDGSIDTDTGSL